MRERATKRKLRTKFSSARVITRETQNLFDANNSCSDGVVDFWHRYKSQIFFYHVDQFPDGERDNGISECEPSVIRPSQNEERTDLRCENGERKTKGYGCSTRDSNNTESRRDGNQKRHSTRRTGSNFKKSHEGRRRSRWNEDVSPLENWVTIYGLCWSLLSPISRIVVSHSVV